MSRKKIEIDKIPQSLNVEFTYPKVRYYKVASWLQLLASYVEIRLCDKVLHIDLDFEIMGQTYEKCIG